MEIEAEREEPQGQPHRPQQGPGRPGRRGNQRAHPDGAGLHVHQPVPGTGAAGAAEGSDTVL